MVDCSLEHHQPIICAERFFSHIFTYVCVYLLNSGVKSTHQTAVVSKIDSRLEQYTSAIEVSDVRKVVLQQKSALIV